MLFLLVSCCSFILLSKFSIFMAFPSWRPEMGFLSFQSFPRLVLRASKIAFLGFYHHLVEYPSMNKGVISLKEEALSEERKKDEVSLLDLPDLPLECILERLSPAGLACMSGVCKSLRAMSTQDHLWERHLKQKWGKLLVGDSANRAWHSYIASEKKQILLDSSKGKGYFGVFMTRLFWPFSWRKNLKPCNSSISLPVDSIMNWYLSLESGNFSFPAQVYNRENGNVGFLLSCYDAKVSYDSNTNTFKARYSAQGRPTTEENIDLERIRAPTVDTSPYDLHISDCLNDLQPGDHIEIQWRKSKEFPYGWWYGVVGHLESCDGNKLYCQCHRSDVAVLEFKQYSPGSRWREVVIDRKDHREVGNEADGFYAGIRKLHREEEISMWKCLWPNQPLEY